MGLSNSAIADGKSAQFSVTVEGGAGAQQVQISLKESVVSGKTVCVIGANGFIGSHIVKQLLSKGYRVRGSVRDLAPDAVDFLKILPRAAENLSLFQGDIMDEGCFDEVFKGCDCVFHLASPTLNDQEDMKNPEKDMIDCAVFGTMNVLQSCKRMGVKSVVLTSSMCAATIKPATPEVIHEAHWADTHYLRNKGSYYAASKTLAERKAHEFVSQMSTESAFRLIRICPTFTIGPMLQPVLNSSMKRFAAICGGTHHDRIPNRSISLIDVRDTAAHHIAAYEKGHHGRFMSLTEAWPWTLVYEALKVCCPKMKCPEPLPKGTKLRPVKKYLTTRMKVLGVNERSFLKVLVEAAEELERKNLIGSECSTGCLSPSHSGIPLEAFLGIGGYYDIGMGDGRFFMVEVKCTFSKDALVVNNVQLSWLLVVGAQPTVIDLSSITQVLLQNDKLICVLPNGQKISLIFRRQNQALPGIWTTEGSIGDTNIAGVSFLGCVPFAAFIGRYFLKDSSQSITFEFDGIYNCITDNDGNRIYDFSYNPLQREFFYQNGNLTSRLYFNAAAGNGLRLTLVQFGPETGSTTFYFKSPVFEHGLGEKCVGAVDLASFAGYYPLKLTGSFVSIVGKTSGPSTTVTVGICTNDKTAMEFSNFVFEDNTLTFESIVGLSLNFEKTPSNQYSAIAAVTVEYDGHKLGMSNIDSYFAPVSLSAFGPKEFESTITLSGTGPNNDGDYALQIINVGSDTPGLKYYKDGKIIFDTFDMNDKTTIVYNSIEQVATISNLVILVLGEPVVVPLLLLNFTYSGHRGVTCAVTTPSADLQSVLYAVPPSAAN